MPKLVEAVKCKTNETCYVTGIKKGNCSVRLNDMLRNCLIIDLDKPESPLSPQAKRCDYLVFADCKSSQDFLAVIELKDGALDASDVIAQLQAGANCAQNLVSQKHTVSFWPLVFYKSAHKIQLKKLKKAIQFHNHKRYIKVGKCGQKLLECCK